MNYDHLFLVMFPVKMRNTVNVGSKRNLLIQFGGMKCRSEENVKKWRFRTGELILKACSIYVGLSPRWNAQEPIFSGDSLDSLENR